MRRDGLPDLSLGAMLLVAAGGAVASILWWGIAGHWTMERSVAFIGVSMMSLSCGLLLGFLFSAYEGEQASVGKVRDWLIGAITGIVIAKAAGGGGEVYGLFAQFKPREGSEIDVPLLIATAVTYATAGFFLMYVMRELQLNPAFRAARKKADEIAKQTSVETDAGTKADRRPAAEKKEQLAPAASDLLKVVEEKNLAPQELTFEALVKTARAYYATNDFATALGYLREANRLRPQDAEIATLLASALNESGKREEGVQILRRLADRGENVPAVYKILGYYLLWFPDELQDSVRYSMEYLKAVPNDSGAIFNLACAYAQLFGEQQKTMWRDLAIAELRKAIAITDLWRERARDLTDFDFAAIRDDPEFQTLIA
jgi:tetratricopeptide (TPR) repeat protein